MTEAGRTQKFIEMLKRKRPQWQVLKFNDRTTRGIPDMCVCNGTRTMWIECKMDKGRKPEFQRWMLDRLGGKYLIFDEHGYMYLQSPYGQDKFLDPVTYISLFLAGRL